MLQQHYPHLHGLPLPSFHKVQPLVLTGSDYPHLIVPIQSPITGSPGAPTAVHTAHLTPTTSQQCHHASSSLPDSNELMRNMATLFQIDTLPQLNEKEVTASPDTSAMSRELHVFCDASERVYGSVTYQDLSLG